MNGAQTELSRAQHNPHERLAPQSMADYIKMKRTTDGSSDASLSMDFYIFRRLRARSVDSQCGHLSVAFFSYPRSDADGWHVAHISSSNFTQWMDKEVEFS